LKPLKRRHDVKKNKLFEDLKSGLEEAIAYEQGKIDLKTTAFEIPEAPPALSKKKIKDLRENTLGVSQPIFALLLGVSAAAVKAWEQGNKKPSGTARRLMQLVENDPGILQKINGPLMAKAHR
jgi:putative transcriptional regulator